MNIRATIIPIAALSICAGALTGCSQGSDKIDPDSPFRPTFSIMAQCQNGKMVVVKSINTGKKSEGAMTTSHEGAQCKQIIEPRPTGSRYVVATLLNNKDATLFYPGLHTTSEAAPDISLLPLKSGEYMIVLAQKPNKEGTAVVNPADAETVGNNKLFKQLEKTAIGRTAQTEKNSGEKRFWPTYGQLWQCQDGKMVLITTTGKPPRKETHHKANPSVTGKSCKTLTPLTKGALAMTGRLDANDDLAVSGIYKSDGVLYSPSETVVKGGEYLLALVEEPGKQGDKPVTGGGSEMAQAFNSHPLVKPLIEAAPPLTPANAA